MLRPNATDLIADFYEAATGDHDWLAVGRKLCQLIGAEDATLALEREQGGARNLLRPFDTSEAAYRDHYRNIDPIRAAAGRALSSAQGPTVRMEREIVSETTYLRSEFYTDYARHAGQRFSIVGSIGDGSGALIGFFRDARSAAFADRERDLLLLLMPHLRRALHVQRRLSLAGDVGDPNFAGLGSSITPCIVVDSDLRVIFANPAGRKVVENRSTRMQTHNQ